MDQINVMVCERYIIILLVRFCNTGLNCMVLPLELGIRHRILVCENLIIHLKKSLKIVFKINKANNFMLYTKGRKGLNEVI